MKDPNYTPVQEARIRELAASDGANGTTAAALAAELGKTSRSVIAKMVRMDIGYVRKVATSKSGEPVVSKADLVSQIASVVDGNLDGLDKAPKDALKAIARFAASL